MSVVKPTLSAEALACLEKLNSLNLWPIVAYLTDSKKGCGWTLEQAFRAIGRYKTFLFISYLYPQTLLVPTPEIDRVWHVHILHTRQYRQDCQMLFGRFIDHEPDGEGSGIADQPSLNTDFIPPPALLVQYFGEVALADALLEQPNRIEPAQNQPQLQKLAAQEYLHLHRSACGRPKTA